MNLNITIKYGGDGTTSQINDVPSSCTIIKLKKIVAQINKMENTTSIRLVQRGKILQDNQKIGDLFLNSQNSLIIYATGIPGKIHKTETPQVNLRAPGQLNTPLNMQNQKVSFVEKIKNFVNENKKGLTMLGVIFVLTIALAIAGLSSDSTRIPRPKTRLPNISLTKGEIDGGGIFLLAIILLFIVWLAYVIKRAGINTVINCIILFFKSMLPNFDVASFKREHEIL